MSDQAQSNAQFAQSLFAALPAMIRRRNEQQANVAFTSLQRRWQEDDATRRRAEAVADQNSQFQRQVELSNLTSERYRDIERERSLRQERRDDAVLGRQIESDLRRAYAAYATLAADVGEQPKPLGDFGRTDQAISSIDMEMARIQTKQEAAGVEALAATYNRNLSSLQALRASVELTPAQSSAAAVQAIGSMYPEDTKPENWAKAVDAVQRGGFQVGMSLMGPQDRNRFAGNHAEALVSLRALRNKELAPQIQQGERALATLESLITQAGLKSPKHLTALTRIGEAGKAPVASAAGRSGMIDERLFEQFAGPKKGDSSATDAAALPVPAATSGVMRSLDEGGLPGVASFGLRALGSLAGRVPAVAADNVRSAYSLNRDVGGAFNYLAGGKKRLAEYETERERELATLRALRDAFSRPWVRETRDAVLQSLLRPEPAAAPQPAR